MNPTTLVTIIDFIIMIILLATIFLNFLTNNSPAIMANMLNIGLLIRIFLYRNQLKEL